MNPWKSIVCLYWHRHFMKRRKTEDEQEKKRNLSSFPDNITFYLILLRCFTLIFFYPTPVVLSQESIDYGTWWERWQELFIQFSFNFYTRFFIYISIYHKHKIKPDSSLSVPKGRLINKKNPKKSVKFRFWVEWELVRMSNKSILFVQFINKG